MFTKDLTLSPNARRLQRLPPFAIAGLLAAGFLAGYNVAFAQEITAEDTLGKQGANRNNGVEVLVAGNVLQIVSQLISMGVVLAWGLATGFALFLMLKVTMGARVTREEELVGLDISEHGLPANPAELQPAGAAGD